MPPRLTETPAWSEVVQHERELSPEIWNGRREARVQALAGECTRDDVADLLGCCGSDDPGPLMAALHLLLYLVVRKDPRLSAQDFRALKEIAARVARSRFPEVLPSTEYPDRRGGSLGLQVWFGVDATAADQFADERGGLESSFFTDSALFFQVHGGGRLVLGPGRVSCRVRFDEMPFDAGLDDSVVVLARLDVTDAAGRAYRGNGLLAADAFFELSRWSPVAWCSLPREAILPRLRARVDYRDHVPVCAPTARGAEPVVLWAKHLSLDVIVQRCVTRPDWLAVSADVSYGRLGGGEVPRIDVAGPWAARLALTSQVRMFWPMDCARAAPSAAVRLESTLSSKVETADVLDWRILTAEELKAAWREPRPHDWFWRRLMERADPAGLEALVLARSSEGLSREQVWNLVAALHAVGSLSTLDRLRHLGARRDFLGDEARHALAVQGIAREERVRELAKRRNRFDLARLGDLLEQAPRPSRDEGSEWMGPPDAIVEGHLQYTTPDRRGDALELAWAEDGTLRFARMSYARRAWPPPVDATTLAAGGDEAVAAFASPVELGLEVAGGGHLLVQRGAELSARLRFEKGADDDHVVAHVHLATADGRAFMLERQVGPDLLLSLLMQPRTRLAQGTPEGGPCLVAGVRPHWPRPTVLAGLVRQLEPDLGYVAESGFDVGGETLLELWRVGATGSHQVACCLRQVERVDGEPSCDVFAHLPALPLALLAPWLCRLDPTASIEPTCWLPSEPELRPQPAIVYVPSVAHS